jgi:hypothetical protein
VAKNPIPQTPSLVTKKPHSTKKTPFHETPKPGQKKTPFHETPSLVKKTPFHETPKPGQKTPISLQ